MRRTTGLAALLVALAACSDPPTEADRAELIGKWMPDDGSGRSVEFKSDGVHDYVYDTGYILRLTWEIDRRGRVILTSGNGVAKTCAYAVAGTALSIDDGAGKSCLGPAVTPPSPMPTKFTRAP